MQTHPKRLMRSRSTSSSSKNLFWSFLCRVGNGYQKYTKSATNEYSICKPAHNTRKILVILVHPSPPRTCKPHSPAWMFTPASTNKNIAEVRSKCGCIWGASKCTLIAAWFLLVCISHRPSGVHVVIVGDRCAHVNVCALDVFACVCLLTGNIEPQSKKLPKASETATSNGS